MPQTIQQISQNIKPPSKLRYFFYGYFALIGDLVDIIGSLTVIGAFFSFILDFFIGIILFIGGFGANKRIKKMRELTGSIEVNLERISRRITQSRRYYAASLRIARRIPVLRKSVRKAALAFRSTRLKILRNPLAKNLMAIIADFIPFIDILPFRTIVVYLTYRDEKRSYEEFVADLNLAVAVENQMAQVELEARLAR